MLRAGSGAADITPPVGAALAGQFKDRSATSIHDPLFARAFVLDDGIAAAAIVSCDVVALTRATVLAARRTVAARTGIPGEHVLICATHTHTGPLTHDSLGRRADADYVATLPDRIATAVGLAYERRQPAEVGSAVGREETASHNRRYLRPDGTAQMHPPKGAAGFVGPEGPRDTDVGLLFARDAERRLIGAIVNYASHPIVVGHEEVVSADYPGYVSRALRAVKGEQAEVLFVNGACGDLCPIDPYDTAHVERGFAWAERVGNLIGAEALRLLETTDGSTTGRVRVTGRELPLAIREVPAERIEWAHETLRRTDLAPRDKDRVYAAETLALAEERAASPVVQAEIQAIAIGDTVMVGIPGELFCEIGLEIKRRSPLQPTLIAELANGTVGYIPTRRAFAHGGYETQLARTSKLTSDAGEQIAECALAVLKELASR